MISYNVENFDKARKALLLPHPEGLNVSIGCALLEYGIAINNLDPNLLDDSSMKYVNTINSYRNIFDLNFKLTVDQMVELSSSIDELANWAMNKSYEEYK